MTKVHSNPAADTPIAIEFRQVQADFADGGHVHLETKPLQYFLTVPTKGPGLDLDTEYNYIVVGVHWSSLTHGLVQLPGTLSCDVDGDDQWDDDYDRIAHIDRAIGALQRAKALLSRAADVGDLAAGRGARVPV